MQFFDRGAQSFNFVPIFRQNGGSAHPIFLSFEENFPNGEMPLAPCHQATGRTGVGRVGLLTDDFDDERVLDASVFVRHNARVVAAVEQTHFIHANEEPRLVPRYL